MPDAIFKIDNLTKKKKKNGICRGPAPEGFRDGQERYWATWILGGPSKNLANNELYPGGFVSVGWSDKSRAVGVEPAKAGVQTLDLQLYNEGDACAQVPAAVRQLSEMLE